MNMNLKKYLEEILPTVKDLLSFRGYKTESELLKLGNMDYIENYDNFGNDYDEVVINVQTDKYVSLIAHYKTIEELESIIHNAFVEATRSKRGPAKVTISPNSNVQATLFESGEYQGWRNAYFRMFISHITKKKDKASSLKTALEEGKCARTVKFTDEEDQKIVNSFFLLTTKPVIYCANISENDIGNEDNEYVKKVREYAKSEGAETIALCAKIEEELTKLDKDEREMFKEELGIKESGLDKLVTASYSLLGLMSYLTAGETEVRAWTIKKGTKAPQAAGKIHTDFEKGFIKAEVVKYDDLIEAGSYNNAREKGKVRIEGKDYVVEDGDIMLFRFNV